MLVSCLTPTHNRREFWPRCISCFQSQTHPELEWVIVDNGTDPIKDLLPNDPRIKYVRLPGEKLRHGQLMNICMENSTGEIAIVWDDDDFYASNRVAKQVQPLTDPQYDICGTTTLYYYLHGTEQGFIYKNLTPQKWLAAPAWRRSIWEKNKFENLVQGADTAFMRKIPMDRWCDLADLTLLVSTIHKTNAAVKRVPSPSFPSVPWAEIERVMKTPVIEEVTMAWHNPSPPPAYKQWTIVEYALKFKTPLLVETGTCGGDTLAEVHGFFEHAYSIELSSDFYRHCQGRFIGKENIHLYQGDSALVLYKIFPLLNKPTIFWLDAHWSGDNTVRGSVDSAAQGELDAILGWGKSDIVLLVDDIRAFDGNNGYPTIESMKSQILAAHPDWVFEVRDDIARAHRRLEIKTL